MLQNVLIFLIVCAAALFLLRRFFHVRKGVGGCGCGCSGGCDPASRQSADRSD